MKKGQKVERDISGRIYGALKVLEFSHTTKRRSFWKCICDCGKEFVASRKCLIESSNQSCGCIIKQHVGNRSGPRSWEDDQKFTMNKLLNKSKWKGQCLIWEGGTDWLGNARTSFLNVPLLIRILVWFFFNPETQGKLRVIMICGNPTCINIKHMGLEAYDRRNKVFDRLSEISKNRR